MTNEEFLKHTEKYFDTKSFEHAKKLVAVAEAAKYLKDLPAIDCLTKITYPIINDQRLVRASWINVNDGIEKLNRALDNLERK